MLSEVNTQKVSLLKWNIGVNKHNGMIREFILNFFLPSSFPKILMLFAVVFSLLMQDLDPAAPKDPPIAQTKQ